MWFYRKNKRGFKCIFVCLFSYCFIYIIRIFMSSSDEIKPYVTYFSERNFHKNVSKKILIWTPIFSDTIIEYCEQCKSNCNDICKCTFTVNKSEITTADAVIFQNFDLFPRSVNWKIGTKTTISFPTYRRPDQVWILFNMEPPSNMFWDPAILNGVFNWTAWYRQDATLMWLYGSKYTLNHSESNDARKLFGKTNFHQEKSREVAGMISNCKDQAERYKLVHKMQNFVTVDMYGGCYDRPCGSVMKPKSCDEILKQYKFYLALENSLCKDYVTEKYWNALKREQIPIVNWKNISEDIVISNSYINVFDFKDIKSLANYVKKVSSNATLYNSYFLWKTKYKDKGTPVTFELCRLLSRNSYQRQVYSDFGNWIRDDICPKVTVVNNMKKQGNWWLFQKLGIDISFL
ncbi:alpha-(1,3)-fucosyltransferase fut-3-like [Mercenaria mercenaria]|uniref:alpha-(1,3)-fucosyltransferase fut-3-like n=1 Tax=Mercenaria mercenaria TaxID=6596 RepID=UPI00234F600B|nr:alpha-(1,3)-fucosyltransferase fut-3-like [Mercenaria mercenaria]